MNRKYSLILLIIAILGFSCISFASETAVPSELQLQAQDQESDQIKSALQDSLKGNGKEPSKLLVTKSANGHYRINLEFVHEKEMLDFNKDNYEAMVKEYNQKYREEALYVMVDAFYDIYSKFKNIDYFAITSIRTTIDRYGNKEPFPGAIFALNPEDAYKINWTLSPDDVKYKVIPGLLKNYSDDMCDPDECKREDSEIRAGADKVTQKDVDDFKKEFDIKD